MFVVTLFGNISAFFWFSWNELPVCTWYMALYCIVFFKGHGSNFQLGFTLQCPSRWQPIFSSIFFNNSIRVKDDRCLICWKVHQKHRRGSAVDVLTLTWNLKELSSMNAHLAVPADPFLWPSERNIDGIHAKNPYSMLTYLISSDPHFNPVKDMLYHFYFLKPGAIKWLTYVNRVNG